MDFETSIAVSILFQFLLKLNKRTYTDNTLINKVIVDLRKTETWIGL